MADLQLYSYYRSSSAYRVRIALQLKGLSYDYHPIHLVKNGGEQHLESFRKLNPMAELPTLIHQGRPLSQSMAILQYLDALWPSPPLFPEEPYPRAKVVQLCEIVNSGIQPIQNLRVLQELEKRYGADKAEWSAHWIEKGFQGLERTLQTVSGAYAFGDQVTAADLYIVPQVYNARRFNVDMEAFPIILGIEQACLKLPAFLAAEPTNQPDTP